MLLRRRQPRIPVTAPAMFPPVIALIGACLAVMGSRWPVATMPMGDTVLGDASQAATWAVRAGAALVVAGLLLSRRWRWLAWAGWILAATALLFAAHDLWSQIIDLKQRVSEAGDPEMMRMIEQTLDKAGLRAGTACLAGGLILQFAALMMARPKPGRPA